MKLSRRKFMVASPITAGAVLTLGGDAAARALGESPIFADRLSQLGWQSFLPFVNTDFTFGQGGNAVVLRLVDIKDLRTTETRGTAGQECFALRFQGPFDRVLSETTHKVNHFNLGDFDLFITDGGRQGREQFYTAVINRIVK